VSAGSNPIGLVFSEVVFTVTNGFETNVLRKFTMLLCNISGTICFVGSDESLPATFTYSSGVDGKT
jgi:hypothetical protein